MIFIVKQISSDGHTTTYKYSGNKCPLFLTFTATRVVLDFTSDYSVQYSGFSIGYKVQVPDNAGTFSFVFDGSHDFHRHLLFNIIRRFSTPSIIQSTTVSAFEANNKRCYINSTTIIPFIIFDLINILVPRQGCYWRVFCDVCGLCSIIDCPRLVDNSSWQFYPHYTVWIPRSHG